MQLFCRGQGAEPRHWRSDPLSHPALAQMSLNELADLPIGNAWISAGEERPQGHFTSGGMLDKIASMLPPVFSPKIVPRS